MKWQDIFIDAPSLHAVIERKKDKQSLPAIFDCRFQLAVNGQPAKGKAFYQESHLPTAHYLDLELDLSAPTHAHSSRHPWPSIDQINATAKRHGLTQNSPIVFYDNGKLAFAGRAWLAFQLAGYTRSRLLNGGIEAYNQAMNTDVDNPNKQPGELTEYFYPVSLPVKLSSVTDLDQRVLIDAREDFRYRGEKEPIDPVAGTIPGAINAPWLDNFDADGGFKPLGWHQSRWSDTLECEPPIHFCGSGVTAIVNLISALLGSNLEQQLYPGGWSEYLHTIK